MTARKVANLTPQKGDAGGTTMWPGRSGVAIQDEGVTQGSVAVLDYVGAGVTATVSPTTGKATITIPGGGGAVDSVNGQTGVVVLDAEDVGAIPQGGPLTDELETDGNAIVARDGATLRASVVVDSAGNAELLGLDAAGSTSSGLLLTGADGSLSLFGLGGTITLTMNSDGSIVITNFAGAITIQPDGSIDLAGMVTVGADFSANLNVATLGFFGTSPASQPVVPLTVPLVQDVIDALVALGLVSQSD